MIERVLENWLIKANERSFQVPLCHALAAQGHRVVHLSRHTGMEMGKDILTVGPDGVPCAYQLKGTHGGKLSMSDYRRDVQPQLHDLVFGRIVHPSITSTQPHHAYLVINGELQEEVSRQIFDFNQMRVNEGNPERLINTLVRGDLFKMFQALESDFWPNSIEDIRALLELYMDTGNGSFPKEKLATLLAAILPFDTEDGESPSKTVASRAFASGAVLCSLSLSAFTANENHAAEFEAWMLYFAYVLAVAEKWGLEESDWKAEADIALRSMVNALARLCDELMQRTNFLEGFSLCDPWVYRVRMTYLLGLMSLYALWRRSILNSDATMLPSNTEGHDAFLREFCSKHHDKLTLWGEYAVPQFLAHYLFYRKRDATMDTEFFLLNLIQNIAAMSTPASKRHLASPYSNAEEVLPILIGLEDDQEKGIFPRASYTLEALFQLFVRCNFKQHARKAWPSFTRAVQASYTPKEAWEYYLWRCEGGLNREGLPFPTQKWFDLRVLAAESQGSDLPTLIKQYPVQYLGFLCVFPHRWSTGGVRWLATQILQS